MYKLLFIQNGTENSQSARFADNFFSESKPVFFAEKSKGPGGDSGDPSEDDKGTQNVPDNERDATKEELAKYNEESERKTEKVKKVMEKIPQEAFMMNQDLKTVYDRFQRFLHTMDYEPQPDIDVERIKDARSLVDINLRELNQYDSEIKKKIRDFARSLEISDEKERSEVYKEIWKIVYKYIPEFSKDELDEDFFNKKMIDKNAHRKMFIALKRRLSKYRLKKGKGIKHFRQFCEKMQEYLPNIAEQEFEMLKTINEVKEVMWDMYEKRQAQEIKQRLIKSAERYTGIPLQMKVDENGKATPIVLESKGVHMKSDGSIIKVKHDNKDVWKIEDVYANEKRVPDPEKNYMFEQPMMMSDVWVKAKNKRGRVFRMPIHRFKRFVNLLDAKPKVDSMEGLYDSVAHLREMNIKLGEGMFLEYDEFRRNLKTRESVPVRRYVQIQEINDKGVVLDDDVLYRSILDSTSDENQEYKKEMTFGEFAKWLNKRKAIPVLGEPRIEADMKTGETRVARDKEGNPEFSWNTDALREKLLDHYYYMNKLYDRNPECHGAVEPAPGQVIFADAPGNPLFKIASVDEKNGTISLKVGNEFKEFSFPQFLRWVYEYDIEPYDKEYERRKAENYLKAGKKDQKKIQEAAERRLKHYEDTGVWRHTLEDLEKRGAEGVHIPDEDPVGGRDAIKALRPSNNFLRKFFKDTVFLRIDDVFELFKSGWEYYHRNWQRRQKARYSEVGKGVPWFGTEFERVNQQAENEEVQQFQDAMDQWGVWQIEDTLYQTNNKDQAKACLIVLAKKGMMRWEDPRLWRTINKFTSVYMQIPIPPAGSDPYQQYDAGAGTFMGRSVKGLTGLDLLPQAIDSLWGESTHIDWKRESDGAHESNMEKSYNKAKELENDPKNIGGIHRELAILLEKHMNDEYVDPAEFEGMIRFIIEAGKGAGEDKVFHLLMGCTAENSRGRTLMGWERVGHFISKYCNAFPAVDFFTDKNPKRDPVTGKFLARPWIKADFKKWTKEWIDNVKNTGSYEPPASASSFLWDEVLTSDAFQTRLEKGIRNANAIDHDDAHFFIPALKESEMESICSNTGGDTKKFTIQAYKNAYTGFGMRIRSLYTKYDQEIKYSKDKNFAGNYFQKLTETFKSYVRYDSVIDNRYRRSEKTKFQRFNDANFDEHSVVDWSNHVREYKDEMTSLVKEVVKAYGMEGNEKLYTLPFIRLPEFATDNKAAKAKQAKIEEAIGNFGGRFEQMIMSDGGKKFLEVVGKKAHVPPDKEDAFIGAKNFLTSTPIEEKIQRKMQLELQESGKVKRPEFEEFDAEEEKPPPLSG